MADETNSKKDETLSLEQLVKDSNTPGAGTTSPDSAKTVEPSPAPSGDSLQDLENSLNAEDPAFSAGFEDLKNLTASGEIAPENLNEDVELKGWRKILHPFSRVCLYVLLNVRIVFKKINRLRTSGLAALKTDGKAKALALVASLKHGAIIGFGALKATLTKFAKLSKAQKAMLAAVVVLGWFAFVAVRMALKGDWLPAMHSEFLRSFAQVADQSYGILPREEWSDFQGGLDQPLYTVQLEKIVTNLRRGPENETPMASLEIFFEVSSNECAIEFVDRQSEFLDLAQSVISTFTYPDLYSPAGQLRLKNVLKKRLSESLTKGRIKKVYFNNMILKP